MSVAGTVVPYSAPSLPRTRLPLGLETLKATTVETAGVAVCARATGAERLSAQSADVIRRGNIGSVTPGAGGAGLMTSGELCRTSPRLAKTGGCGTMRALSASLSHA